MNAINIESLSGTEKKTVVIHHHPDYDEYRVPNPGEKGKGAGYFTDDKKDAEDTAKAIHGKDINIVHRSKRYDTVGRVVEARIRPHKCPICHATISKSLWAEHYKKCKKAVGANTVEAKIRNPMHKKLKASGWKHSYVPEDWTDIGDGETGPVISGHPGYHMYTKSRKKHYHIIDSEGVHHKVPKEPDPPHVPGTNSKAYKEHLRGLKTIDPEKLQPHQAALFKKKSEYPNSKVAPKPAPKKAANKGRDIEDYHPGLDPKIAHEYKKDRKAALDKWKADPENGEEALKQVWHKYKEHLGPFHHDESKLKTEAKIFSRSKYEWRTYTGKGHRIKWRNGKAHSLTKEEKFGLRPATSKKGMHRLVFEGLGVNKVHTISDKHADVLRRSSKPMRSEKASLATSAHAGSVPMGELTQHWHVPKIVHPNPEAHKALVDLGFKHEYWPSQDSLNRGMHFYHKPGEKRAFKINHRGRLFKTQAALHSPKLPAPPKPAHMKPLAPIGKPKLAKPPAPKMAPATLPKTPKLSTTAPEPKV